MSLNKFYDIIVDRFKEYQQYNKFLLEKQEELREKRKENARPLEQMLKDGQVPDEALIKNISDNIYDYHSEEVLYKQDCSQLFYTLYLNVKTYLELGEGMILPKEITELCTSLEHTIPKPFFVVELENEKLAAKEIEKGRAEKQREFFKTLEVDGIRNQILKTLQAELEKPKE
jgi:hypothetical protein